MTGELLKTTGDVVYRKIKALNYSSLSTYATSPLKFYNEFILGNKKEDENSISMGIGSVSDCLILECDGDEECFQQKFDEQFVLNTQKKGTKQVFVLADEVFKIASKNLDSNGKVVGNFTVMFQEAFSNVQSMKNAQGNPYYSGKGWDKGLIDFNDNGKEYYNMLLSNIGKVVVDDGVLHISKRIKDQLFSDDNLGHLFRENENFETFNKFPIEFSYKGWNCKSEIDKFRINHNKKEIELYDLKCTYLNEDFGIAYLKDKYYLQAGWYNLALKEWKNENGMDDYMVLPMKFIVADSSPNKRLPLLYETSKEHLLDSFKGFTFKGRNYKGIDTIIDEITWANDSGIWNITGENYKNKSIVKLPKFNDV